MGEVSYMIAMIPLVIFTFSMFQIGPLVHQCGPKIYFIINYFFLRFRFF